MSLPAQGALCASEKARLAVFYDQRVSSYRGVPPGWRQLWERWCAFLLAYGGDLVVPDFGVDDEIGQYLAGATIVAADQVRFEPGRVSQCHANSAALFCCGRADSVGTGYALSPDGLWRKHSWAWDGPTVLETTEVRLAYAGVRLSGDAAVEFARENNDLAAGAYGHGD